VSRLALAPELAAVRAHAPVALIELEAAYTAACTTIDRELADALRRRIEAAADGGGAPAAEREEAVLGFADQFVVHVQGITAGQREAAAAVVGEAGLHDLARTVYVFDLTTRLRRTLVRLYPEGQGTPPPHLGPPVRKPLGVALEGLHAASMRLRSLDPPTTELVRLHCARHHDCKT